MLICVHDCKGNQIYDASYPNMMRARYGTGVFLNLEKRICNINIELTPCGADFLRVVMDIGEDHYTFWPSSAMGGQFSEFMGAVYAIYSEECDHHNINRRHITICKDGCPRGHARVISKCFWDEEGSIVDFSFSRVKFLYNAVNSICLPQEDPIEVTINSKEYIIDGREFAYAIAKAATSALKKYGFYGYFSSTGSNECLGDIIDINQLLFFKAYALNVMETRKLTTVFSRAGSWQESASSSFEDELSLLLFDM